MKTFCIVLFSLWFLTNIYLTLDLLLKNYKYKGTEKEKDLINGMTSIWGVFFMSIMMLIVIAFNILFEAFKKRNK